MLLWFLPHFSQFFLFLLFRLVVIIISNLIQSLPVLFRCFIFPKRYWKRWSVFLVDWKHYDHMYLFSVICIAFFVFLPMFDENFFLMVLVAFWTTDKPLEMKFWTAALVLGTKWDFSAAILVLSNWTSGSFGLAWGTFSVGNFFLAASLEEVLSLKICEKITEN